jgi:hypothetical protein
LRPPEPGGAAIVTQLGSLSGTLALVLGLSRTDTRFIAIAWKRGLQNQSF